MHPYWHPRVRTLTPYVPGEQPQIKGLIKLNTNEFPYPPSPRVEEAIRSELGALRRYPDPQAKALIEALAERYQVEPNWIFVGNGSDEVLGFIFAALMREEAPLRFPEITYSFYEVFCRLYGLCYEKVPLEEDFTISPQKLAQLPAGGVVLANPNAPTGIALPLEAIETIAASLVGQATFVVDEAYVDFGAASALPLVARYENLIIVQTFSKSRALAGLRVGYAIAQPHLIEALWRVKDSFNSYPLDRLAQAGAIAALEDEAYYVALRKEVIAERERLTRELQELDFRVLPSQANFLLVAHRRYPDARLLAEKLRAHAVLVRHFADPPRIAPFLRITVGMPEENTRLLQVLTQILI